MAAGRVRVTVGIPTFNRASLLRETVESVLAQTYTAFQLLICDNASDDDTMELVAAFADPRVRYVRSSENIGLIPNQNRVMELAETEYLVVLPDDDLLYPDHLAETVATLDRNQTVGFVHTAFDVIDATSQPTERSRMLLEAAGGLMIESGPAFLERSMRSPWTVCWPSALFRTEALTGAGRQRVSDGVMQDFPLLMRIARDWDVAFLPETLAATRMHAGAATVALASSAGGRLIYDDHARILHQHRLQFIDEANLQRDVARRYRAAADDTYRRETVRTLADRAGLGKSWTSTWSALTRVVRDEPRAALLPETWKLVAAQLGGRRAKRAVGRFRRRA